MGWRHLRTDADHYFDEGHWIGWPTSFRYIPNDSERFSDEHQRIKRIANLLSKTPKPTIISTSAQTLITTSYDQNPHAEENLQILGPLGEMVYAIPYDQDHMRNAQELLRAMQEDAGYGNSGWQSCTLIERENHFYSILRERDFHYHRLAHYMVETGRKTLDLVIKEMPYYEERHPTN